MARAALAAGADGLLIEVHNDPEKALSDGAQSLFPEQFEQLMKEIAHDCAGGGQENVGRNRKLEIRNSKLGSHGASFGVSTCEFRLKLVPEFIPWKT